MPVDFALQTVNYFLATAQWLILGRLVLGLFIRNPANAVWQVFVISTEPPHRVSRALTRGRLGERWIPLVSLVWLLLARLAVHAARRSLAA